MIIIAYRIKKSINIIGIIIKYKKERKSKYKLINSKLLKEVYENLNFINI
jgi:hypothetical protein